MSRRVTTQPGTRDRASYGALAGWLGRLARLDLTVFNDVRAERSATAASVMVVLVASLLAGVGSWIWAAQHDQIPGLDSAEVFLKTVVAGGLIQTAIFFVWVYLAHVLLVRAFAVDLLFGDLARVMGIAFAPVGLSILVGIAPLAVPFGVLSLGLTFLLMNEAIEHGAGVTRREAVFANTVGFGTFLVFMGAFANVAEAGSVGGLAPGILFFSLDF